jgi:hypothetical protein
MPDPTQPDLFPAAPRPAPEEIEPFEFDGLDPRLVPVPGLVVPEWLKIEGIDDVDR